MGIHGLGCGRHSTPICYKAESYMEHNYGHPTGFGGNGNWPRAASSGYCSWQKINKMSSLLQYITHIDYQLTPLPNYFVLAEGRTFEPEYSDGKGHGVGMNVPPTHDLGCCCEAWMRLFWKPNPGNYAIGSVFDHMLGQEGQCVRVLIPFTVGNGLLWLYGHANVSALICLRWQSC